jgi:hypothetical protein
VAFAQQAVGEMRTKKSGGAGDKYAHGQRSMLQNSVTMLLFGKKNSDQSFPRFQGSSNALTG